MILKKQFFTFFLISSSLSWAIAQSPLNLTSNVDLTNCTNCTYFAPYGFFSSETHVVNAFNFARRAEETQLGLGSNILGNLTLPSGYSSWAATTRALYILNAERTARAGVSYSGTTVLGLPLEGLETHLTTIAQNHTQDMITNNFFDHLSPTTNLDPNQRIDNSATYGAVGACRESMTYAENIYVSCTSSSTTPTYTVEQAMFSWIYQDGTSWGHRKAVLIQNANTYGATGFTNNVGSSTSEGHLGIGIGTRVFVTGNPRYVRCSSDDYNAHIVTMNIADPKPSCVANYVLPIELLDFTGIYKKQYVQLKWTTASEKDNAYFIVERSKNGRDFMKFSEIKGVGISNQQTDYALDDITPLQGINYYRLVQVDYDGKQSYSQTIAVNTGKKTGLSVFPNPTNGIIHISTKGDFEEQIEISNLMGEIVLKTTINDSKSLDLTPFSAGIYIIRTSSGVIQRITKY